MFLDRSLAYLGIISNWLEKFAIYGIVFKVFGLVENIMTVIWASIAAIIIMFGIGYVDVKYKIINEEQSFQNRFNPEIQNIKKAVNNKK